MISPSDNNISIFLARMALLAVLGLLQGCTDDPLERLLTSAEMAESSGDYAQAITDYRAASQLAPDNNFVRWRLSKALLRIRDGRTAEQELAIAARLQAGDNRIRPAIAEALFLQGRYDDVVALPTNGMDHSYKSILLAFQTRAYLAKRDLASAAATLAEAQALSPYMPEVAMAHAELSLDNGDIAAATASMRRIDMLEPNYPYSPAIYAAIAERRGDLAAALNYYAQATSQPFVYWHDRLMRGQLYLRMGNTLAAIDEVDHLLESMPEQREVVMFAQRALAAHGETERAAGLLQRWLELTPKDADASYELARIEWLRRSNERARKLASDALSIEPAHTEAARLLATIALNTQKPAIAETQLRQLSRGAPDDLGLKKILAANLVAQDKAREAATIIDELIRRLPGEEGSKLSGAWAGYTGQNSPQSQAMLVAALGAENRQPFTVPAASGSTLASATASAVEDISPAELTHRLLQRASKAAERGETLSAAKDLRRVLAVDASNYEALAALVTLSASQPGELAIQGDIDSALEEKPDDTAIMALQVEHAESVADWSQLAATLERILSIEPSRDDVRARLAMVHLEHNDDTVAALKVLSGHENSSDPNLIATLAEALYRQGAMQEALDAYQALRAMAPGQTASYLRIATILGLQNNPGAQQRTLEHLVERAPRDAYAQLAAARLLASQGKTAAARSQIRTAGLGPDDPEVIRTLAQIALQEGAYDEATRLTQLLMRHEKGPAALLTHVRMLALSGDWQHAIELLERRIVESPADIRALRDLAAAYAATGQPEAKLAALEKLVLQLPDDSEVLNNLAWALRNTDPARAARIARRARELEPTSLDIADTLATVLARQQAFPDAIEIASNAIEQAKAPAPLLLRRAEILVLAGNTDEALGDLRAINPVDIPIDSRERRMLLLHALQP